MAEARRSFVDEGHWQDIVTKLRKGDYVFIEFGHNDEKKEDPKRFKMKSALAEFTKTLPNP